MGLSHKCFAKPTAWGICMTLMAVTGTAQGQSSSAPGYPPLSTQTAGLNGQDIYFRLPGKNAVNGDPNDHDICYMRTTNDEFYWFNCQTQNPRQDYTARRVEGKNPDKRKVLINGVYKYSTTKGWEAFELEDGKHQKGKIKVFVDVKHNRLLVWAPGNDTNRPNAVGTTNLNDVKSQQNYNANWEFQNNERQAATDPICGPNLWNVSPWVCGRGKAKVVLCLETKEDKGDTKKGVLNEAIKSPSHLLMSRMSEVASGVTGGPFCRPATDKTKQDFCDIKPGPDCIPSQNITIIPKEACNTIDGIVAPLESQLSQVVSMVCQFSNGTTDQKCAEREMHKFYVWRSALSALGCRSCTFPNGDYRQSLHNYIYQDHAGSYTSSSNESNRQKYAEMKAARRQREQEQQEQDRQTNEQLQNACGNFDWGADFDHICSEFPKCYTYLNKVENSRDYAAICKTSCDTNDCIASLKKMAENQALVPYLQTFYNDYLFKHYSDGVEKNVVGPLRLKLSEMGVKDPSGASERASLPSKRRHRLRAELSSNDADSCYFVGPLNHPVDNGFVCEGAKRKEGQFHAPSLSKFTNWVDRWAHNQDDYVGFPLVLNVGRQALESQAPINYFYNMSPEGHNSESLADQLIMLLKLDKTPGTTPGAHGGPVYHPVIAAHMYQGAEGAWQVALSQLRSDPEPSCIDMSRHPSFKQYAQAWQDGLRFELAEKACGTGVDNSAHDGHRRSGYSFAPDDDDSNSSGNGGRTN